MLLVVDTHDFIIVLTENSIHRNAVLHSHGNNVCQIVFPLGIFVIQGFQPGTQTFRRQGQHTSVNLGKRFLLAVRILLFNDSLHHTGSVAHNSAIAGGIFKAGRQ